MEYQVLEFFLSERKHKVIWETLLITLDRFVEIVRFNLIKLSKVLIEHYFLSTDQKDPFLNNLLRYDHL